MTKPLAMLSSAAIAGFAAVVLWFTPKAPPVAAQSRHSGQIHFVKDCATFSGLAGSYCTIVASDLEEIPIGSQIYYDQPGGGPPIGSGILDSNILVYVGTNDWAVGRCTLDGNNNLGVCTLQDGTGPLAGFNARVDVAYKPGGDGALFTWDGIYRFNSLRDR